MSLFSHFLNSDKQLVSPDRPSSSCPQAVESLGLQSQNSPKKEGPALRVDTACKLGRVGVGRQTWEVVLQSCQRAFLT